jgi:hypothetical protein
VSTCLLSIAVVSVIIQKPFTMDIAKEKGAVQFIIVIN